MKVFVSFKLGEQFGITLKVQGVKLVFCKIIVFATFSVMSNISFQNKARVA